LDGLSRIAGRRGEMSLISINPITPHLQIIIDHMCKHIGVNPETVNFKDPFWYNTHEWTFAQEREFFDWMVDYLMKNKDAVKEIMFFPASRKKSIERFVHQFILNYGWKYKYDEKIN
jgi:hypothetical protein